MKKVVYIFVALMLLAGCTIDAPTVYDPEVRLLFHPEMYHHIDDEEAAVYPLDQDFSVCAWTGDREWLPLSRAFSQEVSLTDSIRKIQVTDTLWAFDEMVMWPTKKQVLTVTAYSPYDEDCEVSRENGVQWSTDVLEEQVDLLYAHKERNRMGNVNNNIFHLPFNHALSRVSFRVKNRVDNTGAHDVLNRPHKITVTNIIIEGVKHKGSFCSLPEPTWTLDEDMQRLEIFDGSFQTSGTPEPIGNVWLMVPQTFNTKVYVQFEYTTVEPTTITQRLGTVPLTATIKPGHDYTYTLSVGIDDVLFLKERLEERIEK
jgi:hypothetical protein